MWLAIKLAAKPKERPLPDLGLLQRELGSSADAIRYRRLFQDYPRIELGPDEDFGHHFTRLKAAEQQYQDAKTRNGPAPAANPVIPKHDEIKVDPDTPSWANGPQVPSDLGGMPRRIPGLNTGDSWAHDVPPEWVPRPVPLPNRTPGTHYVDPALQAARPQPRQQSHDEWIRGLADKGIYLHPDGSRMTAEDMVLPQRPLRGQQIWEPFTRQAPAPEYAPRHRAAAVAYVKQVLGDAGDDAVAAWWRRHNAMTNAGWDFHESGGGNYYEKQINGKRHRIMGDNSPDGKGGYVKGWTHYEDGRIPAFYEDIRDALIHAHRGQQQAGFSIRERPNAVPDSSYQPERGEPTRPMGQMIPPKAKGKYQTLSRSWETS